MSENRVQNLKKRFPDTYCKFPHGIKWPFKEQDDWRFITAIKGTRMQFVRGNIAMLVKPIDAVELLIKTRHIGKYWH